jgi:hypothetical protein
LIRALEHPDRETRMMAIQLLGELRSTSALPTFKSILQRGIAYGLFNTGYGLAWFIGSAVMGLLHDTSLTALSGFSVFIQLSALPLLWLASLRIRAGGHGAGLPFRLSKLWDRASSE